MTEHFNAQTVLMSVIGGIAFVCIAFVVYWKLLGEKHLLRERVPVPARVSSRNQADDRQQSERYAGAEI